MHVLELKYQPGHLKVKMQFEGTACEDVE